MNNQLSSMYSTYTTESLEELISKQDYLTDEAREIVKAILAERSENPADTSSSEALEPEGIAIRNSSQRTSGVKFGVKNRLSWWKVFPLHLLAGYVGVTISLIFSPDSYEHPFLFLSVILIGGYVGLILSQMLEEHIYRTRKVAWLWLLGLVPVYGIAGLVAFTLFGMGVSRLQLGGGERAVNYLLACSAIIYLTRQTRSRIRGQGLPVLIRSSASGDIDGMKIALENGIAIDQQDDKGGTALAYAVLNNQAEAVRWLLEHGADATIRSKSGTSPVDLAEKKGFIEVANLLKEHLQNI